MIIYLSVCMCVGVQLLQGTCIQCLTMHFKILPAWYPTMRWCICKILSIVCDKDARQTCAWCAITTSMKPLLQLYVALLSCAYHAAWLTSTQKQFHALRVGFELLSWRYRTCLFLHSQRSNQKPQMKRKVLSMIGRSSWKRLKHLRIQKTCSNDAISWLIFGLNLSEFTK